MCKPSGVSRGKKVALWLVATPLILIVIATAAWGIDARINADKVARNVTVAGEPVGGMTHAELVKVVDDLVETYMEMPAQVVTDDFTLETSVRNLGVTVNAEHAVQKAWRIGRDDPIAVKPIRWTTSLFNESEVALPLDIISEKMAFAILSLELEYRSDPVEPKLEFQDGKFVVIEGTDGRAIQFNDVAALTPLEVTTVEEPLVINVSQHVTSPRATADPLVRAAEQANKIVDSTYSLTVGDTTKELSGSSIVEAISVGDVSQEHAVKIDVKKLNEKLQELFPISGNPANVKYAFHDGRPVPSGGEDVEVCCGDGAGDALASALLAGTTEVDLPTRVYTAAQAREWANGLGVKEIIGSFTTNFKCCESRVTNIQRISDLTQGILIAPGTTFSVNDTVGRRTRDKGFVEGGVIINGKFETDVGGGVSQYATTLFNAAFFGGLEIPEYKAHSKYISRYPFGREATLFYPSVDLKIRNDTPYGIVIWPHYTNTSVTVDLWSTRTAVGEETAKTKRSGCGAVTTTRTRTFTDGRVEQDTFRANYDCD